MTVWKEKKVTIFGLGRSGIAAAKRLIPLGSNVTITESLGEDRINPDLISEMKKLGVKLELGGHTGASTEQAELIVMSPGVHSDIPVILEAKKRNIPVISEIELAYRFFCKPIIAVTGTNGKTTTTTLIAEFLKAAGKNAAMAGNIGTPLISINDKDLDFIVVEISSYQLETILTFRPWISLILNLTEDHIERHKSMEAYAAAKARIFMNQRKTDYLIYNAEDKRVSDLISSSEAVNIPFSKKDAFLDPKDIRIPGEHNLENALAAAQAARICGVPLETIKKVLADFKGVEHRIEFVREMNGVKFYNDSKGTNPDSTVVALKALSDGSKNIFLIAGGRDKGGDLADLAHFVSDTVKRTILIGEAAPRLGKAFKNDLIYAKDLKQAIDESYSLAGPGDIILLSPACASFDMFSNFEERGRVFKELVSNLK